MHYNDQSYQNGMFNSDIGKSNNILGPLVENPHRVFSIEVRTLAKYFDLIPW